MPLARFACLVVGCSEAGSGLLLRSGANKVPTIRQEAGKEQASKPGKGMVKEKVSYSKRSHTHY